MILADHTWWHTWGEYVVWVAAIVTALGLLSRTKPVKWLWYHLVTRPMTEWGAGVVGAVVDEKVANTNGGTSVRDDLVDLKAKQKSLTELASAASDGQEDIKAALANIHACLDRRFADTHAQMEKLTAYTEEVLAEALGARERIRQLYRSLDVPIIETNAQGWVTYVNPAWSKLTGLSPEEAMGEGWGEVLHPDDRDRVFETWGEAVHTSNDFTAIFRLTNRVTGHTVEVRGSASPLHDAKRRVVGWVATLDEIAPSTSLDGEAHEAVEET